MPNATRSLWVLTALLLSLLLAEHLGDQSNRHVDAASAIVHRGSKTLVSGQRKMHVATAEAEEDTKFGQEENAETSASPSNIVAKNSNENNAFNSENSNGAKNNNEESENSHTEKASTVGSAKLGFTFVMDNANDIETVDDASGFLKSLNDKKKEAAKEEDEKQRQYDEEGNKQLAQHEKEKNDLRGSLRKKEEDRKKAYNEQIEKAKNSGDEAKAKRVANEKAEKDAQDAAQEKAEKEKQEAAKAAAAKLEEGEKLNEQKQKGVLRQSSWQLKREVLKRANELSFNGAYTYMFWVKLMSTKPNWSNILHKGQENVNRNPAVWFYPGQSRLHVRSGTVRNANWYNGGNDGCDPTDPVQLGVWTHVAITHGGRGMNVYINGENKCFANIAPPVENSGDLWLADPWHDIPEAHLADFRYLNRVASITEIQEAVQAKRY